MLGRRRHHSTTPGGAAEDGSAAATPVSHAVSAAALSSPATLTRLADRVVRAYHGTSISTAAVICTEHRIEASKNDWDWLGWGSYFWEDGLHRAWEWADQQHPDEPAVVSVPVRLGNCLNLCDGQQFPVVQTAYESLRQEHERLGIDLPVNREDLRRPLDCLVLNFACQELLSDVETVRAPFQEGAPVYPGAAFSSNAHVHLCVRRESAFVGPFRIEGRG
jgi:hypothetical protein